MVLAGLAGRDFRFPAGLVLPLALAAPAALARRAIRLRRKRPDFLRCCCSMTTTTMPLPMTLSHDSGDKYR
jgi:hypothetical protein